MRLLNLSLVLLLCAICSTSCKKKTNTITKTVIDSIFVTPTSYPDYMVLKPGNYWVYQTYEVYGADSAFPIIAAPDSFYVEKDSVIGINTYHKLVKNLQSGQQIYFLRDSLSYTVTNYGAILFSSQDFTTVFRTIPYINPPAGVPDTILLTYQMGFRDSLTTVPIGVFPTCTFRQIYHFIPAIPMGEYDYKYARNIGLISQTNSIYSFPGSLRFEDRLIRFHVE